MPAEATAEERREAGKALRSEVPRSVQAEWDPPAGRDPPRPDREAGGGPDRRVAADPTRTDGGWPVRLLPRRRLGDGGGSVEHPPRPGSASRRAATRTSPTSGLYATPERHLVFDLNDFDETLPAPFEWDVKRFAASIAVLATEQGASRKRSAAIVEGATAAYRREIHRFAEMPHLSLFYAQIDVDDAEDTLDGKPGTLARQTIARARRRTNLQAFEKLTELKGGKRRIADDPPLITHVRGKGSLGPKLRATFEKVSGNPPPRAADAASPATAISTRRARSSASAASAPSATSSSWPVTESRTRFCCRSRRPADRCSSPTPGAAASATAASGWSSGSR